MRRVAAEKLGFDVATENVDEIAQIIGKAKEMYLATAFVMGSDRRRFGKLIETLENQHIQGQSRWPESLPEAYNLLQYWRQSVRPPNIRGEGVNFVADGNDDTSTTSGSTFVTNSSNQRQLICYSCGEPGHRANESVCPNFHLRRNNNSNNGGARSGPNAQGNTNVTAGDTGNRNETGNDDSTRTGADVLLNLGANDEISRVTFDILGTIDDRITLHAHSIPSSWILLDSCSNVDVFNNGNMLCNVHKVSNNLRINGHTGTSVTNMQGTLAGYGEVWYDPNGIANVLSLDNVTKKFKVTFDSATSNSFCVHKPDGKTKLFSRTALGLYAFDTAQPSSTSEQVNNGQPATVAIQTVAEQKSRYTRRDVRNAERARELQDMLGRPTSRSLIQMIKMNSLPNCPVTVDDVIAADDIFGPNLGSLKGKTTRLKPLPVKVNLSPIPSLILDRYCLVILAINVMKVNKIPFLVTISQSIRFGTSEVLPNMTDSILLDGIISVANIYWRRGFTIGLVLGDGQFESLRIPLSAKNISINIAAPDKHVPEAERYI